jgi:hypothetical protein
VVNVEIDYKSLYQKLLAEADKRDDKIHQLELSYQVRTCVSMQHNSAREDTLPTRDDRPCREVVVTKGRKERCEMGRG